MTEDADAVVERIAAQLFASDHNAPIESEYNRRKHYGRMAERALSALAPGDRLPGGECEVVSSADMREAKRQLAELTRDMLDFAQEMLSTANASGADVSVLQGRIDAALAMLGAAGVEKLLDK